MAKKGGTLKRFVLTVLFLALVAVVFILLGGGKLLKSVGTQAESVKGKIEEGATSVEKKVEKVKEVVAPGDKK